MLIHFDRLKPLFEQTKVRGAIHLGAHRAEELEGYHACGIKRILWVEANHLLATDLLNRTMKHPGCTVVFCAAYNTDGELLSLNVANNEQSTSLLEFDEHFNEYPQVFFTRQISVPAYKIDSVIGEKGFDRSCFNFANINLQGVELLALQGMEKQIKYLDYVYVKVNAKHLYAGSPLMPEMDLYLESRGFERRITEMTAKGWGDALYTRPETSN